MTIMETARGLFKLLTMMGYVGERRSPTDVNSPTAKRNGEVVSQLAQEIALTRRPNGSIIL